MEIQAGTFFLKNKKYPSGKTRKNSAVFFIVALLLMIAGNQGFAYTAGDRPAQEGNTREKQKPQIEAEKEIAAKVNGINITRESVKTMAARMHAKKEQDTGQPENKDEIESEALERLIIQELAYQKAKKDGLTADPKDMEKALTNLKEKLGAEENYSRFLEASAMTEQELLHQLERAIIVDRIFTAEVYENVSVSEDEIKMEYEKEKENLILPEKMTVIDILFFLDTQDPESMKKAAEILKIVQSDENMDPWKLVPDGTFIVRELEVNRQEEKELYEAAKKIGKGELSGVIVTPDSLHIVKLLEYTPSKQLSFQEVKGTIARAIRRDLQKEKLREWEDGLKKNAVIEIFGMKGQKK